MGGTHHAIIQVIESSGWLLEGTTQYAIGSKLSRDMKRTLSSFQKYVTSSSCYRKGDAHTYHHFRELNNLREVVTKISSRGRFARFLLHDADVQVIMTCTTSIKAIYDEIGVRSIQYLDLISLMVQNRSRSP